MEHLRLGWWVVCPIDPASQRIILKIIGFLESYEYFLPPHISTRFSDLPTALDYLPSKLWRWVGEREQIPLPFFVVCFLPLLRRAFLCIFAWNHIISYIQAYMSAFKKFKNCPIESFLFLQSLLSLLHDFIYLNLLFLSTPSGISILIFCGISIVILLEYLY